MVQPSQQSQLLVGASLLALVNLGCTTLVLTPTGGSAVSLSTPINAAVVAETGLSAIALTQAADAASIIPTGQTTATIKGHCDE